MKKSIRILMMLPVLLLFYSAVSSADDAAVFVADFKKTAVYRDFFDGASISGKENLVILASTKFMAMEQGARDGISREAVNAWKQISKTNDRIAYVEIREGNIRTTLWESKGRDAAVIAEQWGQQRNAETGLNVFLSGGMNGSFESKETLATSAYATVGTYFFQNMLDSSFNYSYSKGGSYILGLSGRVHFLIDPKWDFNLGVQGSYASGGGALDLSGLIGFSNFIAYRSSLDLTLSLGASGVCTLGAGITHYFDYGKDFDSRPKTNKQSVYNRIEQGFTSISTPSRTLSMAENTPWPTFTMEPTPRPTPAAEQVQEATEIQTAPVSGETKDIQPPDTTSESTPTPYATKYDGKKETQKELEERLKKEIRDELRDEQTQKKPAVKKDGTTAGIFIEYDMMSFGRSFVNNWTDWNGRLGFGDDGNFGMVFIIDGMKYDDANMTGLTVGLDIGFDIYPFGRSPSGFYIGPVIGGRTNHLKVNLKNSYDFYTIAAGGEAGIRALMNWLVLDLGFAYTAGIDIYGPSSELNVSEIKQQIKGDCFFRAGLGVMFYASDSSKKK